MLYKNKTQKRTKAHLHVFLFKRILLFFCAVFYANPVLVTFSMNTHHESVSLDLVGSYRIPRYARDALGPSKVLRGLGNVIFPPIFIASLLPPCNEEINSYFIKKHMGLTFERVEMVGYRNNR